MAIQKNVKFPCSGCGCEFTPSEPLEYRAETHEWVARCPVCGSDASPHASSDREPTMDLGTFETSLRAIVAKARMQGITDQQIFSALRAELEWEAELAHNGRHISVQLIDLGTRHVATHTLMNPPIPFRARAVGE